MVSYLVFSIFCDTLVIEPTPLKRIGQDMDGFDKHAGCSRMSTPDCVLCSGLSGYTATPTLTPNQSLSSDFTERFQDLCHGKGFLNTRFPLPSPPPPFPYHSDLGVKQLTFKQFTSRACTTVDNQLSPDLYRSLHH